MIALGILIELGAGVLVAVGVVLGDAGVLWLWSGIVVVLIGLLITTVGLRRARPARRGAGRGAPHVTPSSAGG